MVNELKHGFQLSKQFAKNTYLDTTILVDSSSRKSISYRPDRTAFSNSSCFSVPSNAASFLELETLSVSHMIALRKHPKLVVILVGDTWQEILVRVL